jgi:hypothetical protein
MIPGVSQYMYSPLTDLADFCWIFNVSPIGTENSCFTSVLFVITVHVQVQHYIPVGNACNRGVHPENSTVDRGLADIKQFNSDPLLGLPSVYGDFND